MVTGQKIVKKMTHEFVIRPLQFYVFLSGQDKEMTNNNKETVMKILMLNTIFYKCFTLLIPNLQSEQINRFKNEKNKHFALIHWVQTHHSLQRASNL